MGSEKGVEMNIFNAVKRNRRRLVKSAILAVVAIVGMHGVNLWAGSGQVLDAETGKPLHGVFVMAMWNASAAAVTESRSVCYHFAIAKTNERGEYSLPEYSWNFWPFYTNRYRTKEYYLAGYDTAPNEELSATVVKMRRFTGSSLVRLESLLHNRYVNCLQGQDRQPQLVPLYRAQAEEAQRIASTAAEQMLAKSLEAAAIEAEIGYAEYTKKLMQQGPK